METLDQTLMRGVPSCRQVFGGRERFSASLTLLAFVQKPVPTEALPRPSLRWGWGFNPWLTLQEKINASTCGGQTLSYCPNGLMGAWP